MCGTGVEKYICIILIYFCLAVSFASCQGKTSNSTEVILSGDLVWDLSIKVDLSSMTFTRAVLTKDFRFCARNSNFRCILSNDIAWVATPRNLDFMSVK
jgi:predicted permease